jgi:type I restriction enzyme S subunit
MSWRTGTLGDVLTLKRGHDLPDSERQDGDVPVVSSSGVTGHHSESKAKGPGVVTGRYGTIGEVFYIEEDYWPLNTALYVTDFKGNHPRFVAYFLRSVLRNYQSDKAAVPGVNRNVLHALNVRYPVGKPQERIADILAAYDDLIENNRRRMALLEEATRQLYREWFVRLRFPGHEHTRITNDVPEGWDRVPLFDVADPTYGYPFQSPLFTEDGEGLPVVRIRDVLEGESKTFTLEEAPPDRRLQNGDMLIGMDGDFHMGLWAGGDAWLNQRVVRIKSKGDIDDYLLFNMLRDPIRALNETITGTTVVHLGAKELKAILLLVPPHALLSLASGRFAPIGQQIVSLKLQNRQLRAARDLLLPRLMSGEIAV